MRSPRIPKYRHYKPKGLAVVRLDGRDHYLGKFDSPESHQRYRRLVAEWLSRRGTSPTTPTDVGSTDAVTVDELIRDFWRHAEGHYKGPDGRPTQELENLRDALRPLRKLYGDTPAVEFGPLALRSVRQEMVASKLCRTTVNARINRIRRAFRWAVGVELVPPATYQALQAVAGLRAGRSEAPEPEAIAPVPVEHVEAAIPFMPAPVAAMVRLQLLTGCRTQEVLAMRGRDIAASGPDWEYRPARHKNAWRGVGRVIPLGPKARAILGEFLGRDLDAYLFAPSEVVRRMHEGRSRARKTRRTPSELSRRSESPGGRHADHYSRRSYRQAIVRACRRAGVPEWTPLQLRHTAATAIRAKFGLEAAQTVLGHARADVTQLYAERNLARAREVMKEIG